MPLAIAILIVIFSALPCLGQEREVTLSLDDAIARARVRSVDAAVALDELRTAYWEWRTFRADQLPELSFRATAPSYAKQYSSYMDDENFRFFKRHTFEGG